MSILFLSRELGLSAGVVGALVGVAGAGGVLGALTTSWWIRRFGHARTIWLVPLLAWPPAILQALAMPGWGLVPFVVGALSLGYGVVVYNVAQVSFRQAVTPDHLLGRMNASIRFLVWGTIPLGGLLGGVLGTWLGIRPAFTVGLVVEVLAVGWLLASPLRRMRNLPAA